LEAEQGRLRRETDGMAQGQERQSECQDETRSYRPAISSTHRGGTHFFASVSGLTCPSSSQRWSGPRVNRCSAILSPRWTRTACGGGRVELVLAAAIEEGWTIRL